MPAVSPMEEFEVPVGADPSIKVTYKPLAKFTQTSGLMSKTTVQKFHQQIDLKNTRPLPVNIKVTDQYPISAKSEIKVCRKILAGGFWFACLGQSFLQVCTLEL